MKAEVWQRVKAVYSAALRLPPDEREEFAEEVSAGDAALRQGVLELLRTEVPQNDFLERPLLRLDPPSQITDPPVFNTGQMVCGRFRVEQVVGQGGMGKVYRAFDVELGRTVALKTLSTPWAPVEIMRARLRHEASLVSKLAHKGICTLHDLCRQDETDVLVMEFLEGETLRQRLAAKRVSRQEALTITGEILDALDYAHGEKIVHRDVKPANVMLTKAGAKLLDFGIAKLWAPAGQGRSEGSISDLAAGTPPYMAPEQLARKPADARSDLYAAGVMLCEMLIHDRGGDARGIANIEGIQPLALRSVVSRCLTEDPEKRWQTARDLRAALELATLGPEEDLDPPPKLSSRKMSTGIAAAALLLLAGVWLAGTRREQQPAANVVEFRVQPPAGAEFLPVERAGPAVISPNGTALTFVARSTGDEEQLWIRRLDSAQPVPLAGTDGASHPFWAPDSHRIGYFAGGRLRVIDINGGAPRVICEAQQGRGGTWSAQDVILFSPGYSQPLLRVAASGGAPAPVTTLNREAEENSHRWPSFLPDGNHFLFVVRATAASRSGLFLGSLDGVAPRRVSNIASSALFVPSPNGGAGRILYLRGNQVVVQQFSVDGLVSGEPLTVAELSAEDSTTSRAPISASGNGVLLFGGGAPGMFHLAWQDEKGPAAGSPTPALDPGGIVRYLRLAPDPAKVAIERVDFRTGLGSIWVMDTARGTTARMTFEPTSAFSPIWSPDGKNLAFTVNQAGGFEISTVAGEQVGERKELLTFPPDQPTVATDWTRDGEIIFETRGPDAGWDIMAARPDSKEAPRKLVGTPSDERQARSSPDGRWIAYVSNESGSDQVYVAPLRGTGPRIQVSSAGASQPLWGRQTSTVYFIARDRTIMRGTVDFAQSRAQVTATKLQAPQLAQPGLLSGWEYDVPPSEDRVLAGSAVNKPGAEAVVVVQGWESRLANRTR